MMKYLIFLLTLFVLTACSSKEVRVNGLICPEGYSTHQVQKDLTQCKYYDEKAAAEASKSPITPVCRECLEAKGYEIEE
jgi:hypothetical protein